MSGTLPSENVFREWAVRATLLRVPTAEIPRWHLWLWPAAGSVTEPAIVGPDDPAEIYNKGDEAAAPYYRALLANVYTVTDTDDPLQWELVPKP